MFDYLKKYVNLRKYNLVIDIGGNDGTLIREFRKKAPYLKYLNVDASNAFIDANREAGIEYEQKFFDEKFLYPEENKAKLIVSTNVFQHTTPIRSFVRGIVNNLSDHGVWCLEFPYLMTTVFNDNYDQVYHEHVYYFTLTNIIDLLKQEGLTVFNVSFNNIHTGTMRVLSCPTNDLWLSADRTVENFLNLEKYITPEYMVGWGNRLQEKIKSFKNFFDRLKSEGKVIVGFGAAAKGCVFLSSIGVDYKTIPVIIDDTPEKQGKYMPGTGILISPRSALKKIKPDYILILAHNFADYIIKSLEDEYEGKFIIMFPDVKIL
jgi:hypothetical protein